MEESSNISYAVSFIAGLLMFLSPCIFPLIPTYISYLTGVSFKELSEGSAFPEEKRKVRILSIVHSLMFIIGFSIVFVLLGATATALGNILYEFQGILRKIGAVLIIIFGLFIMGVIRIGFLQKERRISYRKEGINYIGSVLVGATFALAWTPCVGPILGSILVYASSTADLYLGIRLLGVFSLGMAIPFFLTALLMSSFLLYFAKIKKYIRWVNMAGGIILVVFGILILSGGIR